MRFRPVASATLLMALVSLLAPAAIGAEQVYFRHDGGTPAADDRALPEDFSAPQAQRWFAAIPPGHSSPCVCGGLVIVTSHHENELATIALDAKTGETRWKQIAPATRLESTHVTSSPAAATPACDGRQVYVYFGSYGLLCYDMSGSQVWSKPLPPCQDEFGAASSPILVDDKLLLCGDHDIDSFLMAVDCQTGETLWNTPRDGFTRSYSTPVISNVAGKRQVIVAGALQLTAYDLERGDRLWWLNGLARIVNTTPTQAQGLLYVATWSPGGDTDARISMEPWSTAEKRWDKNADARLTREECTDKEVLDRFYRIDLNQDGGLDEAEWQKYARVFELAQNTLLAIRPEGSGDITDTQVAWSYQRGLPYVPSPLVYRDVLYLMKDGAILTALDAASGEPHKQGRVAGQGSYYASPVAGDGKLYLASEQGVLSVVRAGPQWEMVSSRDFEQRIMASPVIAGDKFYLRTEAGVYCFAQP